MAIVIGQLVNVKLWDKTKGLELLGSEKNIFKRTTVVEHDVTANMQNVLLESGRRAESRAKLLASREVIEVEGTDAGSESSDSDKT